MNGTRRDNRGRVLRTGESQRADGRYMFKYVGNDGKTRCVYSWRLVGSDVTPAGKKVTAPLREMEREILLGLAEQVMPGGERMTVWMLVERYTRQKTDLRPKTIENYCYVLCLLERDPIGKQRIRHVSRADARDYFVRLQQAGYSYHSIRMIRSVIRPAFQSAMEDDLIRHNPFAFDLSRETADGKTESKGLSPQEESAFLVFARETEPFASYYEAVCILFKTGLRISEFAGLTLDDLDLENRVIRVRRQLQYLAGGIFRIGPPKSASGIRDIPMTDDVYAAIRALQDKRNAPVCEPVIDGVTGFLFYGKNGLPLVARHWQRRFASICRAYNALHVSHPLHVTPHTCRHTFCSRMSMSGMNPKILQYIMGHSDVSMTLNVYTHTDLEAVRREILRIDGLHRPENIV